MVLLSSFEERIVCWTIWSNESGGGRRLLRVIGQTMNELVIQILLLFLSSRRRNLNLFSISSGRIEFIVFAVARVVSHLISSHVNRC